MDDFSWGESDEVPNSVDEALSIWDIWDQEKTDLERLGSKGTTVCFMCGKVVDKADVSSVPFAHNSQKVDICNWCEDSLG